MQRREGGRERKEKEKKITGSHSHEINPPPPPSLISTTKCTAVYIIPNSCLRYVITSHNNTVVSVS